MNFMDYAGAIIFGLGGFICICGAVANKWKPWLFGLVFMGVGFLIANS